MPKSTNIHYRGPRDKPGSKRVNLEIVSSDTRPPLSQSILAMRFKNLPNSHKMLNLSVKWTSANPLVLHAKTHCQLHFCRRCPITENNGFDLLSLNNPSGLRRQRSTGNSQKRISLSETRKGISFQVAFYPSLKQ